MDTKRNYLPYILVIITLLVYPIYVFIGYFGNDKAKFDELILKSGSAREYEMSVSVETFFPERVLLIDGIYAVSSPKNRFSAISTTTLLTSSQKILQSFRMQNIALGNDVYLRIDTDAQTSNNTLPTHSKWHRFSALAIPREFDGISIPGPVMDNLLLLSEEGRFITFLSRDTEGIFNGTSTTRYRVKLSGEKPESPGALSALIDRLGNDALIDIWATNDGYVRGMYFWNPTYRATTTILFYGDPGILAPTMRN